ncbi:hypothetical protein KY285_001500 [Solanum tuberosum]|nr:hypothetical protein KY285_001500 [Solanum tuberosum]
MPEDENVENLCSRSLPKAWETKTAILEDGDLEKMTYDELRGNLMAYEQNHINIFHKDDKRKKVAFKAGTTEVEEEIDETQSEGMALINQGVRQRHQQGFKNNKYQRNDDRCYYCGKPFHIKQNCLERKLRSEDTTTLGAWSQGETSEDDHDKTANICFIALGESSEKVIDEYNKIAQEKKDWQILLEASQIEVDFLEEELEEEKTKKTYKKGMWVIDRGFSKHMCGKKENLKTLKKIDGGYVLFEDNAKGEVVGVRSITLSSSCDLSEVYLVDGLKHNLLSYHHSTM